MAQEIAGNLDGQNLRIGVIVSQFNESISSRLLQGAREALLQHRVRDEEITVVWVPGSLELSQAALRMTKASHWDALVALGTVVRGETAHFDYVAGEAARGIADVARQSGVPIAFGVLTTYTIGHALERAGGKLGNRGYDAATAAIKMANLFRQIDTPRSTPQETRR